MNARLRGVDGDLETSLKEYGFAWIERQDEFIFIYGTQVNDDCEYTRFSPAYIPSNIDPYREWDWIQDWNRVYSVVGMSKEEWDDMPIPSRVYDLVKYYGSENIFGSDYWEGMTYAQVRSFANRVSRKGGEA